MTKPTTILLLILPWAACRSSTSGGARAAAADTATDDADSADASAPEDGAANDLTSDRFGGDGKSDQAPDGSPDTPPPTDAPPADARSTAGCAALGSPCATEGDACSSGDAVEIACREFRICRSGRWQPVQRLLASCQSGTPNACPLTPPGGATSCMVHFQLCAYTDGTSCGCVNGCEGGIDAGACTRPLAWACSSANGAPSSHCPRSAPQLGDPCGAQPIQCTYGPYCSGYLVQCQDGRWQLRPFSAIGGCG
jgi:hypothetical protein